MHRMSDATIEELVHAFADRGKGKVLVLVISAPSAKGSREYGQSAIGHGVPNWSLVTILSTADYVTEC
jgi:hypothetical protein